MPAEFPSPERPLCGVIHLLPTPGSAGWAAPGSMAELMARAEADARAYVQGGVRTLIVENFHDAPFFKHGVGAGTIAALALAVARVGALDGVAQVGVNVLRNDALAGLGVAAAAGAQFVRVNVHTGAMFTDQGLIEGRAAETMAERARVAPGVRVFADVHVKHATPVAGEALEDAARDAVLRGRAHGLIVSGRATGAAPDEQRLTRVRGAVGDAVPLLIGSGLCEANAAELMAWADGAIVGSSVKTGGEVSAPVDAPRVAALLASVKEAVRTR